IVLKAFLFPSSVLIVLLYLGVQSTERDVKPGALPKIFKYFVDNVQPKTKMQKDAQYAIAISVLRAQCTDVRADIQNAFSNKDAKHVKDELSKGQKCLLCTDSRNVIAARPNRTTKEHSEHINAVVPLYRCKRTSDGMECWKCVENNNVDTFLIKGWHFNKSFFKPTMSNQFIILQSTLSFQ
uniref:Uncharacterized protein n=1 Tax=Sinocyclocheilus anshuiensis TaxID=1608454 RepID=A0A671RQV0_9TELE